MTGQGSGEHMSGTMPEPNRPPTGQPGTHPGSPPGASQGAPPQGGYQQPGQQQGGYPPGQPPQGGAPAGWSSGYAPVSEADTRVTGRRVVQYIIDSILAGIIPGLAWWLLDRRSMTWIGPLLAAIISIAVYYGYWVAWPFRHGGQTLGMEWLKLRVISKHGGPASQGQLLIRAILLIVDTILWGLVGWITMMMSRYRQRVGDHAAGTLVIPAHLSAGGGPRY